MSVGCPKKNTQYVLDWQAKKAAAGLCTICGKPAVTRTFKNGVTRILRRCRTCLSKQSERKRRYNQRVKESA